MNRKARPTSAARANRKGRSYKSPKARMPLRRLLSFSIWSGAPQGLALRRIGKLPAIHRRYPLPREYAFKVHMLLVGRIRKSTGLSIELLRPLRRGTPPSKGMVPPPYVESTRMDKPGCFQLSVRVLPDGDPSKTKGYLSNLRDGLVGTRDS
jgi:hypothetical protein